VVPLEIEYEISPSNGTWFDKVAIQFKKGRFFHPDHPNKFTTDSLKLVETIDKKYARTVAQD
jgi:hypothetical protein